MFVVRRVWETKPGEARPAASLVAAMGEEYESADKRSPSRVYFNTSTLPGERNRVYMEWTEDVIASTYRAESVASPPRLAVESVDRRLNGRRDVLRGGDGLDLVECRSQGPSTRHSKDNHKVSAGS